MSGIDLNGRIIIITGGSQGLGRAMAIGLAEANARVVIASPDWEKLNGVAEEIGRDVALPICADITNEDDCRLLLKHTIGHFGEPAVLVNNARYPMSDAKRPFWEGAPSAWENAIKVNVYGTFLITSLIVPGMIERRWGRIVNITTSVDTIQRKHNSPYGVTKAAIEAETVIWAQDLAETGVTCNSLLPGGACKTRDIRTTAPSRGALLSPDVMVPPLLWLASDHSNGHTGGRYVAKEWDRAMPVDAAASRSLEPSIFRRPDL